MRQAGSSWGAGLVLAFVILLFLAPSDAWAGQETRSEVLTALRDEKAKAIAEGRIPPEGSGSLERVMNYVEEGPFIGWFAEDFAGFHPVIGDLATGSGLALGVAYAYPFVESGAAIHASASLSTRFYRRYRVDVSLPELGKLDIALQAQHRDYPQMSFFGLGADSAPSSGTAYRLMDSGIDVTARYEILPWLHGGLRLSGFTTEIGPGKGDFPSTEDIFDETQAPGVQAQPAFFSNRLFVEVDFRDVRANARAGGFYGAYYTRYDDLDFDRYGFDRVDLEATQLLPFFDKRRVFVLHARLAHADPHPGNVVPFYLMPYLGGDDTVRGYREYRFHDRSVISLNAEYRWESFAGLDVALFFDAGDVSDHLKGIRLSDLKTSYGIGFRFSTRGTFVFRIDIGTGGSEGTRAFVKFDHAF